MKARGNKSMLLEQPAKFQENKDNWDKSNNLTTDITKIVVIFFHLSL